MRVFIDINHPAHVHFFKNFIWDMQKRGHEFFVSSRDKEVALDLLKAYSIKHYNRGKGFKGVLGKTLGILKIDAQLYGKTRRFKPDLLMGLHNTYTAHVARLVGKPSITFTDTEHAKLANLMTFPFTNVICTPECFMNDLGKKHVKYPGYHELAYLHPNRFTPDEGIKKRLGVGVKEDYFILRFVSWGASHDLGQKGLDAITGRKLIESLSKLGKVFVISEESNKELDEYRLTVSPERIHDVLAFAKLYVGEGATMASEAAMLGTPAVYINTLKLGYTDEQEEKYGLVYNFTDAKEAAKKALELAREKDLKTKWLKKKENMLKDKVDVTNWMVDYVEDYMKDKT